MWQFSQCIHMLLITEVIWLFSVHKQHIISSNMKGPLLLFGFLELLVKNPLLLSGNILSMKNKLILSNNKHTSWWTDIIREIRILCMCRGDSVFEPNPIKYVRKYSGLDLNWQSRLEKKFILIHSAPTSRTKNWIKIVFDQLGFVLKFCF